MFDDIDDQEEADELFPVEDDMDYDLDEDEGDEDSECVEAIPPPTISDIPGLTGDEDFMEFQCKVDKAMSLRRKKKRIDGMWRINKDGSIPEHLQSGGAKWSPSSVDVKTNHNSSKQCSKTTKEDYQMKQYPQIQGLIGPQRDGYGAMFYTDASTGQLISADQVMSQMAVPQPQYQQPPQYYQAPQHQQPPQQVHRNYPPPQQNQHTHHRQTDGYVHGGESLNRPTAGGYAPPAQAADRGHSSSDWMLNSNTTPTPTKQPNVVPQQQTTEWRQGDLEVTDETKQVLITGKCGFTPAFDGAAFSVAPLADIEGNLIKLVIDRNIKMNKGDHLNVIEQRDVFVAEELIEAADNARKPLTELSVVVQKDNYEVGDLHNAILAANYVSKSNNNKSTIITATISTTVGAIDGESEMAQKLLDLNGDEDFVNTYLDIREGLINEYPAIATYLDRRLKTAVNETLRYTLRSDSFIDDFFLDLEDLLDHLMKVGVVNDFMLAMSEYCGYSFQFAISDVSISGDETFEVLTNVESIPVLLINTEELTSNTVPGVITTQLMPELHEAMVSSIGCRSELNVPNRQMYVTTPQGHTVRVMMSNSSVPDMALHSIVEVVQ